MLRILDAINIRLKIQNDLQNIPSINPIADIPIDLIEIIYILISAHAICLGVIVGLIIHVPLNRQYPHTQITTRQLVNANAPDMHP